MSGVIGSGFQRPDVRTEGGLAVGGVLLGEESCVVRVVVGSRGFDTCVDGSGDSGELGADCNLVGRDGSRAGYGTESTEVDAATIRAGGWCFAVSREHHFLVACVRRLLVDLVESTRDSLKHWGIRCFCHFVIVLEGLTLLLFVLFHVVQAQRDDLDDDVDDDFFPVSRRTRFLTLHCFVVL